MATTSAERMRKLRERRAKGAREAVTVTPSQVTSDDGCDATSDGEGQPKAQGSNGTPDAEGSSSHPAVSDGSGTWRPEWRERKKRREGAPPDAPGAQRGRARARRRSAGQTGPLPKVPELRDEMFQVLREVATDSYAMALARVSAAKAILEETAPKKLPAPEEGDVGAELEEMFGGKSPANAA